MSTSAISGQNGYVVPRLTLRTKFFWTLGNVLMLVGVYLLLYVGGLFADEQYNLMAAQGSSDIALPDTAVIHTVPQSEAPAPQAVVPAEAAQPTVVPTTDAKRFILPELNNPGGGRELNSLVPKAVAGFGPSTVTRIVIPKIKVDRKVVEVGWSIETIDGQQVAIWDVAKYAVGHHTGSANPGQRGNIVLAGHSGGRAYPFNDLYYLQPGDPITLWSNGQQYQFTVTEHHLVDEIGPNVTLDQRRANAHFIEPTDDEVLTLITCWPLTGPDKFTQRVIIRAQANSPASVAPTHLTEDPPGPWTAR